MANTDVKDNGTGKAPVDKIREAWNEYQANDPYGIIKKENVISCFVDFEAGYKSQQAEIERLKGCIKTALIIDSKDGYSMHPKACGELINAVKENN